MRLTFATRSPTPCWSSRCDRAGSFRLALLDKDVGIAAGVAREQRAIAPLLQLTAELFRLAHAELGEEADHVEAARVVERWAGTTIGGVGGESESLGVSSSLDAPNVRDALSDALLEQPL
jgi:hypothetical protein